jgi:hypothetical protein
MKKDIHTQILDCQLLVEDYYYLFMQEDLIITLKDKVEDAYRRRLI